MESMYQQWPGMSLHLDYENSLIELCVHVLEYLEKFLNTKGGSYFPTEDLSRYVAAIMVADGACRGFSVTVTEDILNQVVEDVSEDSDSDVTLEASRGTKRTFEDDPVDDGSDSTEVGLKEADLKLHRSSSSKRIKV